MVTSSSREITVIERASQSRSKTSLSLSSPSRIEITRRRTKESSLTTIIPWASEQRTLMESHTALRASLASLSRHSRMILSRIQHQISLFSSKFTNFYKKTAFFHNFTLFSQDFTFFTVFNLFKIFSAIATYLLKSNSSTDWTTA